LGASDVDRAALCAREPSHRRHTLRRMSPPTIGHPLSRADEAYVTPEKWTEWILSDRGHGEEWGRVFRAHLADSEQIWQAIADAVLDAPISAVRKVAVGVTCEVDVELTINERTATVRSAWHYADTEDAPRLVTAFPTP
jgi:hypothetical protein